jgi:hypothetical protein
MPDILTDAGHFCAQWEANRLNASVWGFCNDQ